MPDKIRPWGDVHGIQGISMVGGVSQSAHRGSEYTSGHIPRGRYEKLTLWTVS